MNFFFFFFLIHFTSKFGFALGPSEGSFLYRIQCSVLEGRFSGLQIQLGKVTNLSPRWLIYGLGRKGRTRNWKAAAVAYNMEPHRHSPGSENGKPRKTILRAADKGNRTQCLLISHPRDERLSGPRSSPSTTFLKFVAEPGIEPRTSGIAA